MNGQCACSVTGARAGPAGTERDSRDGWELLIDQRLSEWMGRSSTAGRPTEWAGARTAIVTSHVNSITDTLTLHIHTQQALRNAPRQKLNQPDTATAVNARTQLNYATRQLSIDIHMSIKTNPIIAQWECKNTQLNAIKFNARTHVHMNYTKFHCICICQAPYIAFRQCSKTPDKCTQTR